MAHFTYEPCIDRAQLNQGDVICRTDEILGVLSEFHPHFCKEDYRFFMVLTQSCDLVRRDAGRCSSHYITLAAVRKTVVALRRELAGLFYDDIGARFHICPADRRSKLDQFVERLLNNNEDRYFFLQKDTTLGMDADHCAFLKLSVPIRANEHYDKLLRGKTIQLKESFQHKLGYLVGKDFSRVATEDWSPDNFPIEVFNAAKSEILGRLDEQDVQWCGTGLDYREAMN